jgi:hypothetical protein
MNTSKNKAPSTKQAEKDNKTLADMSFKAKIWAPPTHP